MSTRIDQDAEETKTRNPLKMAMLVFGIPFVLMVVLAYLMRS